MQSTAFIVVFLIAVLRNMITNGSINYCGAKMCGNTNDHTFCQYPEGPSYKCVGYISAGLSEDEKSRVIDRLNRRRNDAASGRLRELNSAGNMLKLRWVDELAREAQRWADQCQPPSVPEDQDLCRDLYSISVGQCVASVMGEAPGLRIESMVDIWYMQNMLYKGNATIYIPPNRNSSFYGDFAQILWAESYMVGCGRSRFMTTWQGRLRSVERLVCNVAPRGPPPLRPLWSPSAPAALCPSHSKRDTEFHSLCDIHLDPTKIIELGDSMVLEEHLLLYTALDIERNKSINYPGSLDEIYLTRLAIATMENNYTTKTNFSSMQQNDVMSPKEIETVQKTNTFIKAENSLINDISLPSNFQTTNKIRDRKRITLIGRPKPYHMNELNDVDYKTENYLSKEDITKRGNEFYDEYEFVESTEENPSSKNITNANFIKDEIDINVKNILADVSTTEIITEFNVDYIRDFVSSFDVNNSLMYKTSLSEIDLSTDDVNLIYANSNTTRHDVQLNGLVENISVKRENMDEYFTDPETVRELQEALDRLEVDLSTNVSIERQGKIPTEEVDPEVEYIRCSSSGRVRSGVCDMRNSVHREQQTPLRTGSGDVLKVRRELRDLGEKHTEVDSELGIDLNDETIGNKSLDTNPMYKMVLKYLPYLRQYDRGLLAAVTSKAYHLSSSLMLYLCVIINF